MDNKSIFSKNLKMYMDLNGKTRCDISKALNISYYTVSDWVNGKKYPRMDKVEMLARYFGISKSDLIEEKPVNQEINELTEKDYEYIERIKKFSPEKQRLLDIFLTGLEHDQ